MRKKVFVDGLSGTTGLKIHERLALYSELELITIDYEKRRDPVERAKCLNEADLVFLCLPDDGERERGIDVNIFKKFLSPAIGCYHLVHKNRRYFVCICRQHFYTTNVFQPFRVCKGNACNPCPVAARVYSNHELSLFIIVVKFMVKLLHDLHGFRIV